MDRAGLDNKLKMDAIYMAVQEEFFERQQQKKKTILKKTKL